MKTVKSILMLMCIVSLTALTSCSKDDAAGGSNAGIIGKWKCTVDNYNDNGTEIGYDSSVGEVWEFKDGGVLIKGSEMTTYTIDGNNIVIDGGLEYGAVTKVTNTTLILDLTIAIGVGDNYPTDHLEFAKQ